MRELQHYLALLSNKLYARKSIKNKKRKGWKRELVEKFWERIPEYQRLRQDREEL